jgi:aminoglycoside N3'-acetyltransferase|tara:strand:- start:2748 stop:3509 length:762 start_codon:yes stop_codon:yes gene_type:complete
MTKKINNYFLMHLKKLGIKKDDQILVYSDLSRFGINHKNLASIILNALKKIIGRNGTLIMPFYAISQKKNFIFEKNKFSKDPYVGVLNYLFSKEKNLVRSKCFNHNHIGIGPKAKILNFSKANISIGKGSDFYFMMKNNFKLILLACEPNQGATYLHNTEAIFNVPYRKWIKVKKRVKNNNVIKVIKVNYFVRKNKKFISNFNEFFKKLYKFKKKIHVEKVKYGNSIAITLKDLHKYSSYYLKKDKYCLVRKQ